VAEDSALHWHDVAALAKGLRSGALTSRALTQALLTRIEALDPTLGALRLATPERALAAAEAADAQLRAGMDLGPLHGIPYVTKDLFDVAGLVTAAGSRALEQNVAAGDAAVTAALTRAGMVLLGKTNTVEFAFGSVGINHSHGTPHNPWAREHHVPGGSSSGSAVAVAAGFAPLATGTDTACSVRTPAALCGIVGLKTTVGRISRRGVHPLSATLDSVGPLGRRVADVAALFTAMQDAAEGSAAPLDVHRTLHDGVAGLRVAFAEGLFFEDCESQVERAVRACGEVFGQLGAQVTAVDFTPAAQVMASPSVVSMVEGYAVNAELIRERPQDLDPVVLQRMQPGGSVTAVAYLQALEALRPLRAAADRVFDTVDVLLAPTVMIPALPVAQVDVDFDTYMGYAGRYLRNCFPGNLLNLCGLSLPCGFTHDGLPVGLMIYARAFREDLALRVGQAFEGSTSWHAATPTLDWIGTPPQGD
jgi:aspartyl-tRNA(Asn)/glutamyl-tRNA(Gln) amidotransferase subunit A